MAGVMNSIGMEVSTPHEQLCAEVRGNTQFDDSKGMILKRSLATMR